MCLLPLSHKQQDRENSFAHKQVQHYNMYTKDCQIKFVQPKCCVCGFLCVGLPITQGRGSECPDQGPWQANMASKTGTSTLITWEIHFFVKIIYYMARPNHCRQPTLRLHDLCLKILPGHGNELSLFWTMSFPYSYY